MLTIKAVKLNRQYRQPTTLAQILSSRVYTLVMHVVVNMVGARRWCSVVLMLGHLRQWRHRFGVSWPRTALTSIPHDDDC